VVAIVQLNPEMVVTWEDLIKNQAMPAAKKNGTPWRHVYANGAAGTGFTRVTITPITNYAQFDQPGGVQRAFGADAATKYNAKLAPTVHSQQTYIQTLNLQSSIMGNSTTAASCTWNRIASAGMCSSIQAEPAELVGRSRKTEP
jgi:hypothetical protein